MKKNPLITGTLLLTAAGFLSRILGFFYRIFLSRTIGAEGLGIYQMIFPIHGIAFALCAGPIQTSISRLAAANVKKGRSTFRAGLAISLTISVILMIAIRFSAPFLAEHVLLGTAVRPASADNGAVYSVFRHPCLYLRLLLWHEKNCCAGSVPAPGTIYSHRRSFTDRQCRCYKWKNDFCFTGCLGHADR